jgi:hypothetical protein
MHDTRILFHGKVKHVYLIENKRILSMDIENI